MAQIDMHDRIVPWIVLLNINHIVLINWFIPVINNDHSIAIWAIILVVGGVLIPTTYYFAIYFSKKQ